MAYAVPSVSSIQPKYQRALSALGIALTTSGVVSTTTPLLLWGTGVPTEIVPDGSIAFRLDASTPETGIYLRQGGAWVAGSGDVLKAQLALTTAGNGASLVGIEDSATLFAAVEVEGALAEAMTQANAGVSDAAAADIRANIAGTRLNAAVSQAGLADGVTDGKIQTVGGVVYTVNGAIYKIAPANDKWDLSAEVDTIPAEYRAYSLQLDAAGAALIVGGANSASASAAYSVLPPPAVGYSRVGVYIAGPSCDFDGVAGLSAQGTIYHGYPISV